MAAREIIVKKYVVGLSCEEREQLAALARKGRGPAQRLIKARILLKADASEAGEGWSDNQIIEALETSASMVYRVVSLLVIMGNLERNFLAVRNILATFNLLRRASCDHGSRRPTYPARASEAFWLAARFAQRRA
jgi:hypothetical protein